MIPAKTNFAKIAAANVIPHSYAPNVEDKDQPRQGSNEHQQAKLSDTQDIEKGGGPQHHLL